LSRNLAAFIDACNSCRSYNFELLLISEDIQENTFYAGCRQRDEAVFDKAFAKMKAKGYFIELRAKAKTKPQTKSKTKPTALKSYIDKFPH